MNTVCRGHKFAFVHLDIMVACKNEAEHLRYLREMFSLDFLGHRINKNSSIPRPKKEDAINHFQMVNLYPHLNAAEVVELLFKAMPGSPKTKDALEWTHELSNTFAKTEIQLIWPTI